MKAMHHFYSLMTKHTDVYGDSYTDTKASLEALTIRFNRNTQAYKFTCAKLKAYERQLWQVNHKLRNVKGHSTKKQIERLDLQKEQTRIHLLVFTYRQRADYIWKNGRDLMLCFDASFDTLKAFNLI